MPQPLPPPRPASLGVFKPQNGDSPATVVPLHLLCAPPPPAPSFQAPKTPKRFSPAFSVCPPPPPPALSPPCGGTPKPKSSPPASSPPCGGITVSAPARHAGVCKPQEGQNGDFLAFSVCPSPPPPPTSPQPPHAGEFTVLANTPKWRFPRIFCVPQPPPAPSPSCGGITVLAKTPKR